MKCYNCNCDNDCSGLHGAVEDVSDFHRVMGQPIHTTVTTPDEDRINLRWNLIEEEYNELFAGMFDDCGNPELKHVPTADALADLIYVIIGAALEFGIDLAAVWKEVQDSNMRKVEPDGKVVKRADGKVIKPLDWKGPDIKKALGLK